MSSNDDLNNRYIPNDKNMMNNDPSVNNSVYDESNMSLSFEPERRTSNSYRNGFIDEGSDELSGNAVVVEPHHPAPSTCCIIL